MKTNRIIAGWLMLLTLSTLNSQLSTAFAQGSLTPPGAPAPTMKTADQIEPRTIVNAVNTPGNANNLFIISQPGSYYLTTNLVGVSGKNGISITVNNVTLDLNGFALLGASSSGLSGIYFPNAQTNIIVRNGTMSGWFGGVYSDNSTPLMNMVFERLNIFGCSYGIRCGGGVCVVLDCNLLNNFGDGLDIGGGTVSGCSVYNNTVSGIVIFNGPSIISSCFVSGNHDYGIAIEEPDCTVAGNTLSGNNSANASGQANILISGTNRIEDNHVTANGYGVAGGGISVNSSYSGNIIIKNSVSGFGANNYQMPGSQVSARSSPTPFRESSPIPIRGRTSRFNQ